ncbi:bacteriocin [Streptococcus uberis]|uniref:bacteriocin n=1 Tax=Streptococcus uberis TaxID=1349 RepID=UPI00356506CF
MDKHLVLSNQQLFHVVGGNAPGNAVLGGLGGLQTGIKYCKVPHPVLKGVCIVGFTTAVAYLAYKAN